MRDPLSDPPGIVRQAEDLSGLAKRVAARERKSRTSQLNHAKAQAADVLAARRLAKRGQWGSWCAKAGLKSTQAWCYVEFGKLSVTEGFSALPEDEAPFELLIDP